MDIIIMITLFIIKTALIGIFMMIIMIPGMRPVNLISMIKTTLTLIIWVIIILMLSPGIMPHSQM